MQILGKLKLYIDHVFTYTVHTMSLLILKDSKVIAELERRPIRSPLGQSDNTK